MSKQAKSPTRAYKIGYDCATKNLPNGNPHVPGSKQWEDFNEGYEARLQACRDAGVHHPALEENDDD